MLSGGGARGAYQVGVLKRLTEQGARWDLIAGVSVGAINAAHMAHFGVQTQRAGALTLEAFWRRIAGNKSIYTGWTMGALALLWQGAMYDTAPLRALLDGAMSEEVIRRSGVKLRLGAVSLKTGRYRTITERDERLADWVMANAAFPVAFRPSYIDGDLWVDGGVRNVTPILDAVKAGATEIDVVMTSPVRGDVAEWDVQKGRSAIDIGLRAAGIRVELADDPAELARRLTRPVPTESSGRLSRGTDFHAWLEHRFRGEAPLELSDLPGAGDAWVGADPEIEDLKRRFLASPICCRSPKTRSATEASSGLPGPSPPAMSGAPWIT